MKEQKKKERVTLNIKVDDNFGDYTVIKIISKNKCVCKCKCGIRKRISISELSNDLHCKHTKANLKDISGQRFGDWLVLYPTKNGYYMCECQCEEKTTKEVYGTTLRNGLSKSCGHNSTGFKDLTNKQFGNWKVIRYKGNKYWECQCQCEAKTVRDVHAYSLIHGKSKSCGCKSVELIQKALMNNGITQTRTQEQLDTVSSKDNLQIYIENLGVKPTIKELSNLLSLNITSVGRYIHKYELESYVDINSAVSEKEKNLLEYVKSIYNGLIITNSKIVIQGKELDIYIPSENLAIEFNGNYWHSSIFKYMNYHLDKTKACLKQGIRLIHVFEYEWDNECKQKEIKKLISESLMSNNKDRNSIKTNVDCCGIKFKEIGNNIYKIEITSEKHLKEEIEQFIKERNPDRLEFNCDLAKHDFASFVELGFKAELLEPSYTLISSKGQVISELDDEIVLNRQEYLKVYNCGYARLIWEK